MKGICLAGLVLWLGCAPTAAAQAASGTPPTGVDVSGTLGWLNVNKSELAIADEWYNRSLHASVSAGYYWATHHKTEIEASRSTRATLFGSEQVVIGGVRRFISSTQQFDTRRVSIGQQYQFGRNAWFHPYLGAGLDLNWERVSQEDQPLFEFDPVTRQTRPLTGPRPPIVRTDLHVRPYAAAGFKGYMTRRTFFRSELRLVAARRVEEALLRFGFGVDF
jgi:hypothetical protein